MSYMTQMFVSKCIMTIMKCSCTTAIHKGINLNESELCYIQYHLKGGIHNDTHMYLYKQTNMNRHKLWQTWIDTQVYTYIYKQTNMNRHKLWAIQILSIHMYFHTYIRMCIFWAIHILFMDMYKSLYTMWRYLERNNH